MPALSSAALRHAFQGYPPQIGRAAEPLLKHLEVDAGKQRARLVELEGVLSGGKAARGRKVFFGNRAACSTCHAVQKEGGHVGPDLSKIGGIRSGRDLLESIVFPSASIVRGYEPYVITTRDGRQHTGIIAGETAEVIQLIAADRTETRLARTSVETIQPSRVSIMPQGLDAQLSREEMADSIAFLQSLREGGGAYPASRADISSGPCCGEVSPCILHLRERSLSARDAGGNCLCRLPHDLTAC